jgi:uncharacterized protein (PEP-CTERM system associated)
VAYRLQRSTAVLLWSRTRSSRLLGQPGLADDLAASDEVQLQGFSLDLSHRLTPDSSLGLLMSHQRGSGSNAGQNNLQRQLSLRYTVRPSLHSNLTVDISRKLSDSFPVPYDETALVVTLGYRF